MTPQVRRTVFHLLLLICFLLGVVFKQFSIFYPEPFVLIAFAGTIGILVDYAVKISKESILWLIPALLATELIATLTSKAGLPSIASVLYVPGALLFLVYGILFIRSGIRNRKADPGIPIKFTVLGLLTSGITGWEAITYFPYDYDWSHIGWRILYLSVFGWLIFIDLSTKWADKPQLKYEKDILRLSQLVIAAMYFDRFIFQ